MKEYAVDITVNYLHNEKEVNAAGWYPSADTLAVGIREFIESEPDATSFVFSIVQRDHKP